MIGNFKLVKKITFLLPRYSSMPISFENVYYDRFNSVFKGFYLLLPQESTLDIDLGTMPSVKFKKVKSTECFGSQDIVALERVAENELTDHQRGVIRYLNQCINNKKYTATE